MCIFLEKNAAKQEPEVKVATEPAPPVVEEEVFEIVMEDEEDSEEGEEDSSSSSEEGCCCNLTDFFVCFYASLYHRFPLLFQMTMMMTTMKIQMVMDS